MDSQQKSGYLDCWWYVTSSPGYEVMLTWLDLDAYDEYIYVYDSPSSESYQVANLRRFNDENLSSFVSSRGGITIRMHDGYSGINRKTFYANVSLAGTYQTQMI